MGIENWKLHLITNGVTSFPTEDEEKTRFEKYEKLILSHKQVEKLSIDEEHTEIKVKRAVAQALCARLEKIEEVEARYKESTAMRFI